MTDLRAHLATATHAIAKLHVEAEALAMEHVARLDALCAENERLRGELADFKARALEAEAREERERTLRVAAESAADYAHNPGPEMAPPTPPAVLTNNAEISTGRAP